MQLVSQEFYTLLAEIILAVHLVLFSGTKPYVGVDNTASVLLRTPYRVCPSKVIRPNYMTTAHLSNGFAITSMLSTLAQIEGFEPPPFAIFNRRPVLIDSVYHCDALTTELYPRVLLYMCVCPRGDSNPYVLADTGA